MAKDSNRKNEATELFQQGYNCAQALLAGYGEAFGIQREHALKIGAPFGGGIAHTGETCGAVIGALMIIGLRYADIKPGSLLKNIKLNRTSRHFMKKFEEINGSLKCTGVKRQIKNKQSKFKKEIHCPMVVENAARLLEDLL